MNSDKDKKISRVPERAPSICVICGKIFTPPTESLSDTGEKTCSQECLDENNRRNGLHQTRLQKEVYRLMVEKIKLHPKCGDFATKSSANEYSLMSPQGKVFNFRNLALFVNDHWELFEHLPGGRITKALTRRSVCMALKKLAPWKKLRLDEWRGWTWHGKPSDAMMAKWKDGFWNKQPNINIIHSTCAVCGKEFTYEKLYSVGKNGKKKTCSPECHILICQRNGLQRAQKRKGACGQAVNEKDASPKTKRSTSPSRAKEYSLRSPWREVFKGHNLGLFVTTHRRLFASIYGSIEAVNVESVYAELAKLMPGEKDRTVSWHGWTWHEGLI